MEQPKTPAVESNRLPVIRSVKWLYYIKYFFYIAWNWNPKLAYFTIYYEILGEKKYGIETSRLNSLQKLPVTGNNKKHSEIYQGASYYLLEKSFEYLRKIKAPVGFIDVGAGKGRAMVVAAHYGFTKIIGIDFAKHLCLEAEENCRRISQKFPGTAWKVIHTNAVDFTFDKEMQVFFFFNPFKQAVMQKVIKHILQSFRAHPRQLFVVYVNPQLNQLFTDAGFVVKHHVKRMDYVESIVYEKSP